MAAVVYQSRNTKQRVLINEILNEFPVFLSAQEIHDILRRRGHNVGLATVYRGLQMMVDTGEADSIRRAEGDVVYRKCSARHHHHLICRECGATVEISAQIIESWANAVGHSHGFTEILHDVELTGLCDACSQKHQVSAADLPNSKQSADSDN